MGKVEKKITARMKSAAQEFFKDANIECYNSVNHPHHYTFGKFEVIDVIEDWNLGYHLGNAVKYIARSGRKDDEIADLEKATWYLNRYIRLAKEKDCKTQQAITNATYTYMKEEECQTKRKSQKTTLSNERKR